MTSGPASPSGGGTVAALAAPNFRRYLAGQAVSPVGSALLRRGSTAATAHPDHAHSLGSTRIPNAASSTTRIRHAICVRMSLTGSLFPHLLKEESVHDY
jgi:hypothetical protein